MKGLLLFYFLLFCYTTNILPQREIPEAFPRHSEKKTASLEYKPVLITSHESERFTFSYNNNGSLLSQIREVWNSGSWENYERYTYTYDASDHRLTFNTDTWGNGQWVYYTLKESYSYDQSGNRTEILYQDTLANGWVNKYRYVYTFDEHRNVLSETFFTWENHAWKGFSRNTYTYDNSNNCITEVDQDFIINSWVNNLKFIKTYNVNNRQLTELTQGWINNHWVNGGLRSHTYDSAGYMLSYAYGAWVNNIWQYMDSTSYRYNSNYTTAERILYIWIHGTIWESSLRDVDTLNDPINWTRWKHTSQRWLGNNWINEEQSTRTYDYQGNELTYQNQRWINGAWGNNDSTQSSYDAYGNLIHFEGFTWYNGGWIPYGVSVYFFFYSGNDLHVISTGGSIVDAEYTNFTGVSDEGAVINSFNLAQNYPNPFNPATTINYSLANEGWVKLSVYDVLGRKVSALVDDYKPAGSYKVEFDGSNLSSGVYLYRLESGNRSITKKFILMK